MSTGLDAHPGRCTARWVAPVGLCGGAVCLLVGVAVYLGAALDLPPAMWAEDTGGSGAAALQQATPDTPLETRAGLQLAAVAKDLALAGVAVLGTILVSVGTVFAFLDRIGILTAATVQRRDVETPEPRHDLPAPESLSGVPAPDRNDPADGFAWALGHGTAPRDAGTYAAAGRPGTGPVRGAERSPTRTAAQASEEVAATEPYRSTEPSLARASGLVSEEAAGPHPGGPSPVLRPTVRETAAPPHPVDEPPPEPPGAGDLIEAWDDYRRNGDGHFSPHGLQDVLDQWGLDADVDHGDRVGAGGAVLIVETFGTRKFYVLPSFNKSPRAVADWFDDGSGGALTARTQRVTRLAQGRWLEPGAGGGGRFEVLGRGEVG